jgi:Uma2 family endonuclease
MPFDTNRTLDNFITRYNQFPFEFYDNQRVPLPVETAKQSICRHRLFNLLLQYESASKQIYLPVKSPYVRLDAEGQVISARVPHIMVYSAARMTAYQAETQHGRAMPFLLIPDLCVYVLAHDEDVIDGEDRVRGCFEDGVSQVWVIDPRDQIVTLYAHGRSQSRRLTTAALLDGGTLLPGFIIPVWAIFRD